MIKVDAWIIRKFIARKRVTDKAIAEVEDGGKGSGNFGHKGRPGLRGGSGKGGGKAFRTTSKETSSGYIGIQRAKAFKNISRTAHNSASFRQFADSLSKEQDHELSKQYVRSGTKETPEQYAERVYNLMKSTPDKTVHKWTHCVDGKSDLVASYKRDSAKYKHEIKQVMAEQGYDGAARVVSVDEFNKQLTAHPEMPLLARSYSAINADTLQKYDDQLEDGDWYVDCKIGGAQYGQGMYAVGIYGDNKTAKLQGSRNEMEWYRKINEERTDKRGPDVPDGYKNIKTDSGIYYTYNDRGWKDFNTEKPPEGEIVAFQKNYWSWDQKLAAVHNGKLYDLNTGAQIDMSLYSSPQWTPAEKFDDEVDLQSSTRLMTLDSSAKIINLSDIDAACKKKVAEIKAAEKKKLLPEAHAELAKQDKQALKDQTLHDIFSGYRGKREKPTDTEIAEIYKDFGGTRWTFPTNIRAMVSGYSGKSGWNSFNDDLVAFMATTAENYSKGIPVSYSGWDDFISKPSVKAAYDRIVTAAKERAERTYRSAFVNDYVVRRMPAINDFSNIYDPGVKAAMLGYDAINSQNHGQTGSYTVVLNRTKLIIRDKRVKM